jgi:hypothetical protein
MEDFDLKEGRTYLIRYGSIDTLSSITVLLATEKAYHIRWNLGERSNDTWEMKTHMNSYYSIIEDITETMIKENLKENLGEFIDNQKQTTKTNWIRCHVCKGMGTVPNANVTSGKVSCPLCLGGKMIPDKVETQF